MTFDSAPMKMTAAESAIAATCLCSCLFYIFFMPYNFVKWLAELKEPQPGSGDILVKVIF